MMTEPHRDTLSRRKMFAGLGTSAFFSDEEEFVDNEMQGDTLGFDLWFSTEQERHNDGAGPSVPA